MRAEAFRLGQALLTFEEHFARCRCVCEGTETAAWLEYLERRCVVT